MSAKRKRDTLEDHAFLLVCPEGRAHLVDRETNEVKWSMDTDGLLWIASQGKDVKDYVDLRGLKSESEDYKMRLIHHTEEGKEKLVPCDTLDLIKEYFKLHYSDDKTDAFRKPKAYEVEFQSGVKKHSFDPLLEENVNEQPESMILKRIDIYVHRACPLWSVTFAKIEAFFPTTFVSEDEKIVGVRKKCAVCHMATDRVFLEFCVKNRIHGFKLSSPIYDLINKNFDLHIQHDMDEQKITNLEQQLKLLKKNKKIILQTPLKEDTDNGISLVKGEYAGNRAAIEVITSVTDIQTTVVQNLWKLNYHPNIRVFYGWESLASNKYALAYEELELSLSVYVSRNPYNEMSPEALNIMRGLVSAVEHLHDRGFYHGDLNPENIFVQKGTLKIGDLRSTTKIETPSDEYHDLHAIAHIMLFIMSNGSHEVRQPLLAVTEKDIGGLNISGTNEELYDVFRRLGVLVSGSAATTMVCSPPRVLAKELLKHLAYKSSADRMKFVRDLVDFINDADGVIYPMKFQMEMDLNSLTIVPGSNSTNTSHWGAILGSDIVDAMEKILPKQVPPNTNTPQTAPNTNTPQQQLAPNTNTPQKQPAPNTNTPQQQPTPNTNTPKNTPPSVRVARYKSTVVYELLKLMRNAATHINSFSRRQVNCRTLADELGSDVSGLEAAFRKKFPKVFIKTYEVVEQYKMDIPDSMRLEFF